MPPAPLDDREPDDALQQQLDTAARDAAVHTVYLHSLLRQGVEPLHARAMAVAYIQATKLTTKVELPPDEPPREGWQG